MLRMPRHARILHWTDAALGHRTDGQEATTRRLAGGRLTVAGEPSPLNLSCAAGPNTRGDGGSPATEITDGPSHPLPEDPPGRTGAARCLGGTIVYCVAGPI
jgi:hypothetical protein